jgi:O-antigen ligase
MCGTYFIAGPQPLSRFAETTKTPTPLYWLLAGFIIIVFMLGGASRIDVQSLIILRPLSVLACAIALITLRREHLQGRRPVIVGIAAIFALTILHLIPLPPAFWHALPGRQEIAQVDQLTGMAATWRPLTLTPMNGVHALLSLFVPLAVFLFGVQLSREDLYRLLPLLIALGALSGLFGLLQAVSGGQSPFYFYRITNNGSAVGLFANRNHAATLLGCMFPMLAVFASAARSRADEQHSRQLIAAAVAIVLVPLILVTGSRSGLLVAVLGIAGAAILYRKPSTAQPNKRGKPGIKIGAAQLLGALAIGCLGFLTLFFSRAEAISRLFRQGQGEESRDEIWAVAVDMFWKYFPVGSGSGSFVEAFQISEPGHLLNPTYLNRAHNDVLEVAVTYGLPGLLLLGSAAAYYFVRTYHLWRNMDRSRPSVPFARMAGIVMGMVFVASIFDYPLRTPTMMAVFAIMALWFGEAGRERANNAAAEPKAGQTAGAVYG